MGNKYNSLYMTNLISWLEMFKIIYNQKEYEKYLLNRISYLIKIIRNNNNLINIIKNNTKIRKKYIQTFQYIISNYNINKLISRDILYSLQTL